MMATSRQSAEKEEFWRLVLGEQLESGLTIKAFCQQQGVAEAAFYYWRREIKARDAASQQASEEPAQLIPVNIVDSPHPVAERLADLNSDGGAAFDAEIVVPNGFIVRLNVSSGGEPLTALLAAVARCPRESTKSC